MSFKITSEEHLHLYKIGMYFDFETKNCEDISQNCSNEQCFLHRSLELSVNLNGTNILGDMRCHRSHAYGNVLEFIISFYELKNTQTS